MLRCAVIKKCKKQDLDPDRPVSEQRWCLYTSDGNRLLGRHPTKEKAQKQESAIKAQSHYLRSVIACLRKFQLNGTHFNS